MATEWDEYKASVLEPAARAGNVLPQDLFVRYALDGAHRSPERFAARLEETVRYWKTLALRFKVYKALAEALIAAHKELAAAGELTPEAFEKKRREAGERATERVDGWLQQIAGDVPYLTTGALKHLVQQSGGVLDEAAVITRLTAAGVHLIDPGWEVPPRPPLPTAAQLRGQLNLLGLRLSPMVVFTAERVTAGFRVKDGFRLTGGSGDRLTRRELIEAKDAQAKRPHDSRKTAAESVLTVLLTAEAAGSLDQLLRWELAELVRGRLGVGLPVRVAADAVIELGLDQTEALELAVTLQGTGARPAPAADDGAAIAAALSAGALREAERILAALPPEAIPEHRERVRRAAAELAELVAAADAAERAGDTEQAAVSLTDAIKRAADDPDLRARLDRFPPPPPTGVTAGANGGRVTVRWTPSAARTGQIGYRVVRRAGAAAIGPGDGTLVAETTANHAADPAAPVARAVVYTVFAVRGESVSTGAGAGPVTVLPTVTGFDLSTDGRSVTGGWQLPAEAIGVEVTRAWPDGTGERAIPVAGRATGFPDENVELGAGYRYQVRPIYLDGAGERRPGPASAKSIVVEREPAAVHDLAAEVEPGAGAPRLRLTWTAPEAGRVEIRRAAGPAPWPVGTRVSPAEVDAYGEALAGGDRPAPDGRRELSVPAGQGRLVLTAISRGRGTAIAGNSVTLELIAPVSGLRARRRWNAVHVDWIWPPDAHEARIRWTTPAGAGLEVLSRRAFLDNGGFVLETGPAAVTVIVQTMVRQNHQEVLSAPQICEVAARPPRVRWRLRRTPLRRRAELLLLADQACALPPLVLGDAPLAGRSLIAGVTTVVDVTREVPPGPLDDIVCRLAEPAATDVVLAPWAAGPATNVLEGGGRR